jgi:two-component system LytT family sensor kinase
MKSSWYTRKWVTVMLHAAAWILLFSLPFLLRRSDGNEKPPPSKTEVSALVTAINYIASNLLWVGFFYLNAYLILPRFIYKNKYWQYIASIVGCFIIILFIQAAIYIYFRNPLHFSVSNHILFNLFVFLFFLASSIAFRLISDKSKADRIAKEKENENLKTELSLLRSQASPHFMFNVLNNMVALARKQSDQLEPSLIKLSSLMRYMIYEADEEKVALEKETEYLQSYIDLQKQRFGKNVCFNVSLQEVDNHYEIEPMLLIPFVENAIKHGTGFFENAQIDIELKAKNNILQFLVRNKYNDATEEIKDKTSGIGLTNVKRRLNLLYNKNHTLLITRKDDWFTVSLQINLH